MIKELNEKVKNSEACRSEKVLKLLEQIPALLMKAMSHTGEKPVPNSDLMKKHSSVYPAELKLFRDRDDQQK